MRFILSFLVLALMVSGAQAMDCSKARTQIEKTICADASANAADEAMSAAFGRLKATVTPEQWTAFLSKQRQWLKTRESRCDGKKDLALPACLKADTLAWTATLEGRPEAGSYESTAFSRVMINRAAKRTGDYDIAIMLLKFRAPQTAMERAFDAAVDAILKDAPLKEPRDTFSQRKLGFEASMRLTFASTAMISAQIDIYRDGGGAHPNSSTAHVNLDGNGKKIAFADVFTPEGGKVALKLCAEQIHTQRKEKGADAVQGDETKPDSANASLGEAFRDMGNWSFGAATTSVVFDPYVLGSYAEGAYGCDFEDGTLKPFIRQGFPLPN